jgi:uncharacterized membrane protein
MNSPFSARFGLLVAAAVTGAVAISTTTAYAADSEKCFGVAKAGKNDCKTDAHSCAGQSKLDKDPASFIAVPAGSCEKIAGGSTTAATMKK